MFEQGDAGDLVYVVDAGEVEIVRRRLDTVDELVTRVGPGHYFGELAPLFGLRRSASARAGPTGATITSHTVTDFRSRVRPGSSSDVESAVARS